jgi:hypothetical protein
MWDILQSEFVWGIVVGVALSAFAAWLQSFLMHRQTVQHQRNTTYRFASDIVKNLRKIIADLDRTRGQFRAIGREYPELINIEVAIYGRNREHMIHLTDDHRDRLRTFITDVALRRADLVNSLSEFYRLWGVADQMQGQGAAQEKVDRVRETASSHLAPANQAADKLAKLGTEVVQLEIDLINEAR